MAICEGKEVRAAPGPRGNVSDRFNPLYKETSGLPSGKYRIKTPAKLNLRLKVTGRRPDGYHELVTVMVPIDLCDLIEARAVPGTAVGLACNGLSVPEDETNLVVRAAKAFLSEAGIGSGVSLELKKNIPVAAGMGGGSSDAAATLLLLNEMWSRPVSMPVLHRIAGGLGADVPFFLYCRPALATGIGDRLQPLSQWPETWYVTVTPPVRVSTAWAYRQLKMELTEKEYEHTIYLLKKRPFTVSRLLENDLERVTSARYSIIDTIKHQLLELGAEAALMTGSGPTVFGIFGSRREACGAMDRLRGLGSVFVTTNWEGPPVFEIANTNG